MAAGYHPIVTHPERLRWIGDHYDTMCSLAHAGAWMQLTAGSVTGRFGKRSLYWSERMLDEGMVHTDAHNIRNRARILSHAVELVAKRLGEQAALLPLLGSILLLLILAACGSSGGAQPGPASQSGACRLRWWRRTSRNTGSGRSISSISLSSRSRI